MEHRGWDVHVESVGGDGDGGDPSPAALLHGFGSGSFTWEPVVAAGLVADRPAVAFDRFGFGRTARPPVGSWPDGTVNPYSLAGAVELTLAVLDDAGWGVGDPVVLVGHSAGALVALATALAAPPRVAGLVLIAPAVVGGGPPPGVGMAFRLPMVRRWAPTMLRAGRPFLGRAVASAWHDRSALASSGLGAQYASSSAQPGWAEGLVELTLATSPDDAGAVVKRLEQVSVPVLVVAGEHDRLVSATASSTVAERVPDGRLVVVPSCGHVPHEEAPAAVVDAVRPFLLSLGRPPRS